MTTIICLMMTNGEESLMDGPVWFKGLFTLEIIMYVGIYVVLSRQPQVLPDTVFRVPMMPFLPCLSIFMNVYLMMKLDLATWVRFFVWLAIGKCALTFFCFFFVIIFFLQFCRLYSVYCR